MNLPCCVCRKTPCESRVYCTACMATRYLLRVGPEGEPIMTDQEVGDFLKQYGDKIEGICKMEDSIMTQFLIINHGISDDGEGLNITVLAKIVAGGAA